MTKVTPHIAALREKLVQERLAGKKIGFVPTMGALHQGHVSLIERAKMENEVVVCSIYVNPTQFNNPNDLAKYPRTLDTDLEILEKAGCDYLFFPSDQEMYPQSPLLRMQFGNLEEVMEGRHRKGHFAGVGLVVSKLFHIVEPNRAYFGQKDLQQCAIIKALVRELHFNLELVICPTIRENDGLAMSSRNRRLSPEQRQAAPLLYKTLQDASQDLMSGKKQDAIRAEVEQFFKLRTDIHLEYFEIADANTLQPPSQLRPGQEVALCIAAYFGEVRLIDNLLLRL
jgi:pantoate--beta-alanine ligase